MANLVIRNFAHFRNIHFQICDQLKHPVALSIFGNAATVVSLVFLGVPLIEGVSTSNARIFLYFVGPLVGIGFSLVVASTFTRLCSSAMPQKSGGNIATYLILSGTNVL